MRSARTIRRLERENWELRKSLTAVQADQSRLRANMVFAMREIGVPGEGYPAPVENAHRILNDALYGEHVVL